MNNHDTNQIARELSTMKTLNEIISLSTDFPKTVEEAWKVIDQIWCKALAARGVAIEQGAPTTDEQAEILIELSAARNGYRLSDYDEAALLEAGAKLMQEVQR